jgi:glycosyltransferase involved in cell wall biosynthesis
MKINFLWDWPPDFDQTLNWKDGLAAAIKELINRGHDVIVYTDTDYVIPHDYFTIYPVKDFREDPDVILHWGDMTRPHAREHVNLNVPMALCFAGGEVIGDNVELFDHIFVESQVYLDKLQDKGYSASIAFGTNTELFTPIPEQAKQFDTIFPATFALWKRHELYAKATKGLRSLACGYIYHKHETECWKVCLENDVMVLPHVSSAVLRYLYAASRVCVIPSLSSGGSQRTVLEAMAMNLSLVVCDSDKFDYVEGQQVWCVEPRVEQLMEAIDEALVTDVSTRDYILENWSEKTYADSLEKGLKALL